MLGVWVLAARVEVRLGLVEASRNNGKSSASDPDGSIDKDGTGPGLSRTVVQQHQIRNGRTRQRAMEWSLARSQA